MTVMSRQYIDDHDVVARYLANRLSDAERESFEIYFLEHPELVQELNRTAQFKSGLIALQSSGALQSLLRPQPRWGRVGGMAIAASLVLAVIGGGIWFNGQSGSRPIVAASAAALGHRFQAALPMAGSYDIQRTRTVSYDASVKRPSDPAAVELRVKPERTAPSARYKVALGTVGTDDAVTPITEIRDLSAAADGFVSVYLNASELAPAVYELKISSEGDAAGEASSFLIELVE